MRTKEILRTTAAALMLLIATTAAPRAQDPPGIRILPMRDAAFSLRTLAAQVRLTTTLVDRLPSSRTDDNVVVSPAGVASALALMDIGTSDRFRETSRALLGYDNSRAAADDFKDLRNEIKDIGQGDDGAAASYSFANAAVFDPGLRLEPTVLSQMQQTGADVSRRSLAEHSSVVAINDWVASKTNGRITDVVSDGLNPTGLIVLDAMYFKEDWANAFDPHLTRQASFHDRTGAASDVSMMQAAMTIPFRSNDRFAAVDLRYGSGRFSLVLVTTTDRPASFAEFVDVSSWLSGDNFMSANVRLQMPRFALHQTTDVLPALDAAGLATARGDAAAFRPMTPDRLDISAFLQKSYLGINERGTEAAAATTVAIPQGLPPKDAAVTFDKPFVFALRDQDTGLILLSGYIGRVPSAQD
jgi:serpin B